MKNNKGFSAIGVILIVAILSLIGIAAWQVSAKKEPKSSDNASANTEAPAKDATTEQMTVVTDPTADWQSYTDPTYNYTVKFPKDWVRQTENTDYCTKGLVMLAPTKDGLGKCASDSGGRLMVIGSDTAAETNYVLSKDMYPDVVASNVTASGVVGKKYVGTVQTTDESGIGPEAGTVLIHYVYKKDGKVYAVLYQEAKDQANVRDIVDSIATTGLKF